MGNKKAAHLDLPLPTRPATLALPWNATHLSLLHVLRPGGESSRYQIQLGLENTGDLVRFPESVITAGERAGGFLSRELSAFPALWLVVGRTSTHSEVWPPFLTMHPMRLAHWRLA